MSTGLIPIPAFCLVTDRNLKGQDLLVNAVQKAVMGGVNIVQLREKDLLGGELLELAIQIKSVIQKKALFFVNERVDVALACEADGVHLGGTAMSTLDARRLVGNSMMIGRSVHSIDEGIEAAKYGVDYLFAGSIFPTRSHPNVESQDVKLIESLTKKTKVPIIAIGGINISNVEQVLESGASGVAVISTILGSSDPENAAKRLRERIMASRD